MPTPPSAGSRELLRDLFGIEAQTVRINLDRYSLNSLNGFIESERGAFFFKFHQEEGEEAMAGNITAPTSSPRPACRWTSRCTSPACRASRS